MTADADFIPLLQKVNQYAIDADVMLYVTSSFRKTAKVKGAIVTPAEKSNHMIGHAIDMNVDYGKGYSSRCNSACLKATNKNRPVAVTNFIKKIQEDEDLRWGGDFNTADPVHIDDGLNVKNAAKWEGKYQITQSCP